MYLNEAFRALDALNEDTFSISDDGIAKLADFQQNDDLEDEIRVIDPEAETEDELQDSYVGKVIVDCTVCHSKLYKDKEEIELNEDETLANVGEECPFCYTSDGFKIIGEVAAFVGDTETDNTEEEKPVEDDTSEELAESYKDTTMIMGGNGSETYSDDDLERIWNENHNNDPSMKAYKSFADWKADTVSQMDEIEEGLFGKNKSETYTISVKENNGKYTPVHSFDNKADAVKFLDQYKKDYPDAHYVLHTGNKLESLDEDVNNVNVETDDSIVNVSADDNGKVTVTTEPKDTEAGDEVIVPVTDEVQDEITGFETDVDIDEFDEESFDELGESYLKEVYENVESYKTVDVKADDKQIVVEGIIKFNSGASKSTTFVLEARDCTKDSKCSFSGSNKQLTEGNKAYTIFGKVEDKKFISESFNYNYSALVEGVSNSIKGTVRR